MDENSAAFVWDCLQGLLLHLCRHNQKKFPKVTIIQTCSDWRNKGKWWEAIPLEQKIGRHTCKRARVILSRMASPIQWTWTWANSGRWWGNLACCSPWCCKESDMTGDWTATTRSLSSFWSLFYEMVCETHVFGKEIRSDLCCLVAKSCPTLLRPHGL